MPDRNGDAATQPHSAAAFVVGIGASAGGIDALKKFFDAVSPDSGAAYVVILHLSPDHESRLAEVLQVKARIPVTQVTDRVRIEPNHVYVVSPNKLLAIDQQSIVLSEMTRFEQRRAPVDSFFRSLADAQGSRAVSVVLSGTGQNGSAGLKHIKEYGGLVVAQDPAEAEYSDMPRNAIATGLVDLVLPVSEMPGRILAFHTRPRTDGDEAADVPTLTADDEAIREILTLLRVRTGHDFSHYKPGTVRRRIDRRIRVHGLLSFPAYARALKEHPNEAIALLKELLISVTSFFRDPVAFDVLARRVIPRLFAGKTAHEHVRVWVPACATGEEAYSIAILLAEQATATADQPVIQVFATDLDEHAISVARESFYSDAEVADLSEERLRRFFTREAGGYRVRKELRETILFAHHNVLKDPPFSHLDLVSCRNLLIYLNRPSQERLLETFNFALRPGGYLFLGGSESPETSSDLFTVLDKGAHIYESRVVSSRISLAFPDQGSVAPRIMLRNPETGPPIRISPGELHLRLLEQYAPPSVVISDEHNVVHMSESVGRYMKVAGGEPTRDLLSLVHEDLRPDLRTALHQAMRQKVPVRIQNVRVTLPDREHQVEIAVYPVLREPDPARGYLLVTFADKEGIERIAEVPKDVSTRGEPAAAQLEEELARIRQQLRTTIEQYETQAEEAKAGNEELQAINEELRSAAEELETSKEELQSVNEELTTVNQELKIKIEELAQTNDDFQNLISSSDIGTIFLDRELRVKLSTPAADQIFNLRPSDLGRPLSDITNQLVYDSLHNDIRQVLTDLSTVDREVQSRNDSWTLARIRPYRTTDDRIGGVVITFQDITERRRAEARIRQGEERLRLLIDSATDYAIFTMSMEGIIDSWNPGAERLFGYSAEEVIGRHFELLFTPEDRLASVQAAELKRAYETGRSADERLHVRKDGSRFYCSGVTTRLGETLGYAKIARDLSQQQQAAEALRAVQAEFEARVRERTDKLHAEMEARRLAHDHVTGLLKKIVTAQEDERARIARDLHDQLGQQVTAMRLTLEQYRDRLLESGAVPPEVDRALSLSHDVNREVDFLAWELRPAVLDDLGLAAALPRFVDNWSAHYGIAAEYHDRGPARQISPDAEVTFYRVTQEALNNVAKHAHASRVDVMLETRDGSLLLVIEDDGIGFDSADPQVREKGIGLAGMEERAAAIGARLDVESAPGEGTSIFLRYPIPFGGGTPPQDTP